MKAAGITSREDRRVFDAPTGAWMPRLRCLLGALLVLLMATACSGTTSTSAKGVPATEESAQRIAVDFFSEFNSALRKSSSGKAAALVASEKRVRFRDAYDLWKGYRFFDVEALVPPRTEDLMEVRVTFEGPSGNSDTEIKRLQREGGRWCLLDS